MIILALLIIAIIILNNTKSDSNNNHTLNMGTTIKIDKDELINFLAETGSIDNRETETKELDIITEEELNNVEKIKGRETHITDISRNKCSNNGIGLYNMSVIKRVDGYSGVIRGSTWNGCC